MAADAVVRNCLDSSTVTPSNALIFLPSSNFGKQKVNKLGEKAKTNEQTNDHEINDTKIETSSDARTLLMAKMAEIIKKIEWKRDKYKKRKGFQTEGVLLKIAQRKRQLRFNTLSRTYSKLLKRPMRVTCEMNAMSCRANNSSSEIHLPICDFSFFLILLIHLICLNICKFGRQKTLLLLISRIFWQYFMHFLHLLGESEQLHW